MKEIRKPPHISQEDWDSVDVPEWTTARFKRARPAREVLPDLVAAYRRGDVRMPGRRGAQKKPTKVPTSLRLSPDVIAYYKATGAGWQTRMDQVLRAGMRKRPSTRA